MKRIGKTCLASMMVSLGISLHQCMAQPLGMMVNANTSLHQRKKGDPLEHLPSNMEVLTHFGERADISPDNKRVAFMAKTFGDAMVIDVKSKNITCLTCNIPAAAFLRVMHLSSGDYLLIGPDHFENINVSKTNNDLWFLSKVPGSRPVKIGQKVSEGVALSKNSMKIAYTEKGGNGTPFSSRIMVADLEVLDGVPRLVNKKTVVESADNVCTVEAQDFYDKDTKLIFFCYISNGAFDVKGVDLATSKVTWFTSTTNAFNEPEGIFPGGKYTTVEMDRQCDWLGGSRGSGNLDIWKLKLDGTGKNLERLTHFNDYEGGKAANPVVSTDGKFMAFQAARAADPPGMGHGLLLLWFNSVKLKK